MEISQIKAELKIETVLHHYGLKLGKGNRLCCPFHEDKTPSMQIYPKTNSWCCFSGNCKAGTGDVIQFIELKENCSKHEAIVKAKEMLGYIPKSNQEIITTKPKEDLNLIFQKLKQNIIKSPKAQEYLQERYLNPEILEIGYNAKTYHSLKNCLVFPLKDSHGQTISFYGRSVTANNNNKHFYTVNRKGLYPNYPSREARHLIITESIIDAATLLQNEVIIKQHYVLALYGTNGLTTEHVHAIQQLEELKEIILWLDGDKAGKVATEKHGKYLQELLPTIKITVVATPEGEDINSLLDGHTPSVLLELLSNRRLFSSNEQTKELPAVAHRHLNTTNPNKITYHTPIASYYIKGGIRKDLDSLKVTLVIEPPKATASNLKSRNKLDLYEDKQTEKIARESAEKLNLRADLIETDLNVLTNLLDDYREAASSANENEEQTKVILSQSEKQQCIQFLKAPNLTQNINDLIGKAGVVGEENNRIFLFVIASSYKMPGTLHALIQGTSGSGKTHLLATIMDFIPTEDTISLTRVTESSFYNYGEHELQNKLIGIEDYDGLEEKAELAFRELQSKGMISSSTSGKNEHTGEIKGYVKKVYGPIASLSATTRGEIYEDNMSRCFLISVDESVGQTTNIIRYQNDRAAGIINETKELEIRDFLRNCMRLLKPYRVVNPYANKIDLPQEAQKIRRLNDLFQSYVKQITLLNQYQRLRTSTGNLIVEKEDVKTAIEIMFDSIILKVDELNGSLRDFYESLKKYVNQRSAEYEFTRREIRQEIKTSNTQLHRYMKQLLDLEYIYQSSGYDNRGHKYKIAYWDDISLVRQKIKTNLNNQLSKL